MKRKRVNQSLNLETEVGKKEDEILSQQISKSDYAIRAIIAYENQGILTKESLKNILKEVLGGLNETHREKQNSEDDIEDDLLTQKKKLELSSFFFRSDYFE